MTEQGGPNCGTLFIRIPSDARAEDFSPPLGGDGNQPVQNDLEAGGSVHSRPECALSDGGADHIKESTTVSIQ